MKKIIIALILLIFVNSAFAIGFKSKLGGGNSIQASESNTRVSNRAVLPKRGDIAVVVEGSDKQHVRMAEAYIIEELVSHGYRVVDEAKMKRIRAASAKAKAARYALEGNVEAILKINASYSVAATVIARIKADNPVENEFELYTCTSSAAIMAVAGAKKLGGKTSMGKEVGYTEEEAMQKAVDSAVREAMKQMF